VTLLYVWVMDGTRVVRSLYRESSWVWLQRYGVKGKQFQVGPFILGAHLVVNAEVAGGW